jgi:tRNA(Arg) A34 adenosine deaminase TadA
MIPMDVHLVLPGWVQEMVEPGQHFASDADKVAFAIALSRRNIAEQTGGPFGAAVFDPDHRLVAAGVNVVLPQSASLAHAEAMAYLLAQQALRRARLNEAPDGSHAGPYVLATSAQPCCQCYGATVWAGIDRLLIGARSEDVEALTEFDEGPLPDDWAGELGRRGIEVVRDLHRDDARAVLAAYGSQGGQRY